MVRAALNTRPALIALLTTGCVDFGLVAPGEREPLVQIRAEVSHAETLAVGVEVLLVTAADAEGRPYELADPTIYLNGAAVRPAVRPANGIYTFRTKLNPPEPTAPAEFLHVSIPALAAGAATPPAIAVPFTGRRGDVTLSLGAGDDLVLRIAAPDAGHTATSAHWHLDLRASCDSAGRIFAVLQSSGRPPDPLIVPRLILQQLAPPRFEACLLVASSTTSGDAGYRRSLIVQTRAQWHVEIRQQSSTINRILQRTSTITSAARSRSSST